MSFYRSSCLLYDGVHFTTGKYLSATKLDGTMQFKRRCVHLIVIASAYGFLILVARWAFFTEMWTIMGSEPNVDGNHAHALNLDFAVPVRSQRHVKETDMKNSNHKTRMQRSLGMRVLRSDHIARINRRHQLLHNIFTNFLHP